MTYREQIQKMIDDLQSVYDRANALRDQASDKEKEAFNHVRRYLPAIWSPLADMDNKMDEKWANREV